MFFVYRPREVEIFIIAIVAAAIPLFHFLAISPSALRITNERGNKSDFTLVILASS
jgi:hypothetical protein